MLDDATIKFIGRFIGKWIFLPAFACLLVWKMATGFWDAAGVWAIIIPAAIVAAVFYFWQRSTKRSAHPWE
jgi:Na+-driven multidrug efflux pump